MQSSSSMLLLFCNEKVLFAKQYFQFEIFTNLEVRIHIYVCVYMDTITEIKCVGDCIYWKKKKTAFKHDREHTNVKIICQQSDPLTSSTLVSNKTLYLDSMQVWSSLKHHLLVLESYASTIAVGQHLRHSLLQP